MSKYIRTQDGVYEIKDGLNQTSKEIQIALINGDYKQSDTIEELCDEFVYYNPKTLIEKYRYDYYHNLSEKDHDLKWLKGGKIIYGAIWTDKGLIYVAKMNDKGELVLI